MASTEQTFLSLKNMFFNQNKEMEQKYTLWEEKTKHLQILSVAFLTGTLYVIYSILDFMLAPVEILPLMATVHLFFVAPIAFLVSLLTFYRRSYSFIIFLLILAPILAACGNLIIVSQMDGYTTYLTEHYLILFWIFTISGLKLSHATLSAVLTFAVVMFATYFILALPFDLFMMHSFWMLASFSFGFTGSYLMERSRRTIFLQHEQLTDTVAEKTAELQDLNASLEKKVAEKVAKLTEQEQLMIAQSRLAAMGEMMSMIAHQWRQPLATTTLLIANKKIEQMMAGDEAGEYDEILNKISDTMLYLSDTVDNFQTYFKPEKGTTKISICELIERTINLAESRIKEDNISLHIQERDERSVITYANELVQTLINIINNAIDVLVEREIQNPQIWISTSLNDGNLMINIEDNAGGIGNDIIDKIFDPYFSTKSKNGTGLGLYMAKMIIDKHITGTLDVTNGSEGACFSIKLPETIDNNASPHKDRSVNTSHNTDKPFTYV